MCLADFEILCDTFNHHLQLALNNAINDVKEVTTSTYF